VVEPFESSATPVFLRHDRRNAGVTSMNMNWDQIKADWSQLKPKLKEKWKKLTDADLKLIAGRREQLVDLLQQRYGYDKQRAGTELDKFTTALTS
jgi:uncharacterized protein YjbJ (UPF0337 family)